jgi:methylenetetrahydrofolate--tRNA-(uracil-5-)-methyltransferase
MVVKVIGGGLAGSEAAWQLAKRGIEVELYEMRPVASTPAHTTENFAELVCSNSLGSNEITSAQGLLKEELRRLGSLLIAMADKARVPAGGALAVDREVFSKLVTEEIEKNPLITVIRQEVTEIPDGNVIIATGPLTSDKLAEELARFVGDEHLYFYDAAAPIVTRESIIEEKGFWASRYDKGEGEYFNAPLDKDEYERFYNELISAEVANKHAFEEDLFFEGCMPIEKLALRGFDTLRYGPMKPVGLTDPRTGKQPYAVVQLRQDDLEGRLYNLVGFQTSLKWGEQKRVFSLIPALAEAEFVRFGVMHRNTFINAPKALKPTFQTKTRDDLFVAGQITGVEGYVESLASGLIAGMNMARLIEGKKPLVLPETTLIGALPRYITTAPAKNFQPMNANFGLLPNPTERIRKKAERKAYYAKRALEDLEHFLSEHNL